MSYNRTSGKGGTVNSSRDPASPNFNKSTTEGASSPPRKGRRVWPNARNPAGQRGSGSGQNNTD
jgi:hypothetical protein